jgi:hypothetical protein
MLSNIAANALDRGKKVGLLPDFLPSHGEGELRFNINALKVSLAA